MAAPSGDVHALRRDRQLAVPPRKVFWFCACTQENQKSLCVGGTAVGGTTAFRRQLYSKNPHHLKDFHALFVDQTGWQSLFKWKFSSIRGGFFSEPSIYFRHKWELMFHQNSHKYTKTQSHLQIHANEHPQAHIFGFSSWSFKTLMDFIHGYCFNKKSSTILADQPLEIWILPPVCGGYYS